MWRPTLDRHVAVGAGGSVLLTAAYLAVGVLRSYSIPGDGADWLGLVLAAVLVGGVVAVAANRLVPPERRTRRGHARTAVTMAVLPMGIALAVVGVLLVVTAGLVDAVNSLEAAVAQGGPLEGSVAILAIALFIAAIILVVFVALGVLIGGIVLNASAIAGYAVVTLLLERSEEGPTERATGLDPPDGGG